MHAGVSVEQVKRRIGDSGGPFMKRWLFTIYIARCWHTSDVRDRVNAVMSAMPPYYTLGFQPDYSKSVEDVFISATVHLLLTGRSWSHLQFLAPSGSPYLPSWTIDFTDARPITTAASGANFEPLFKHVFRMFNGGDGVDRPRFGADADAPFRLRQMTRGVLEAAGFIVDEVVSVSSLFTVTLERLDCADYAEGVLRAWHRILSQNKRYTRQNMTLRGRARKWEAFCRTLCTGRVGKVNFDASHTSASEALWDMVIHDRQRHPEGMREDAQALYEEMEPALHCGRFIVTRRRRIGVAPWEVTVGDSIGILASGFVPFTLRSAEVEDVPGGHAYILIGGCYIDGKTNGGCFLLHKHN
jgi:hypothetical protein